MKQAFLFGFLGLCQIALSQHYSVGDTLNVVALDGLNIRSTPENQGEKIGTLRNGEKVIIIQNNIQEDNNFGFDGHWVQVKSQDGSLKGYAFDAFISRFPVIEKMTVFNQSIESDAKLTDIEMLPEILKEYSFSAFKKQGCESYYYNGSDGEGSHSLKIINLEGNDKLILHGYWEGNSTELELSNVRSSEVYYLVKNLLQYYAENSYTLEDTELRNAQYSFNPCVAVGPGGCIIRIVRKSEDIISIYFYFPCC